MNQKFMKALMLLDREEYERAEETLNNAIAECDRIYELIPMKECYAELMCDLGRYSEALDSANFITDNSEAAVNYDLIHELDAAVEIKNYINRIEAKGDNTQ